MKRKRTVFLCQSAIIAALYVVLTAVAAAFGLSSGEIQVRFSEALCILPCFFPAAVPGLAVGCLLANLLTGCAIVDVFLGAFATLLGAIGTYFLRKHKILMLIPPIVSNAVIIPIVLKFVYQLESGYLYLVLTVTIGEIISAGVLGFIFYSALKKHLPKLK